MPRCMAAQNRQKGDCADKEECAILCITEK